MGQMQYFFFLFKLEFKSQGNFFSPKFIFLGKIKGDSAIWIGINWIQLYWRYWIIDKKMRKLWRGTIIAVPSPLHVQLCSVYMQIT